MDRETYKKDQQDRNTLNALFDITLYTLQFIEKKEGKQFFHLKG